jgi:hypothetical protein
MYTQFKNQLFAIFYVRLPFHTGSLACFRSLDVQIQRAIVVPWRKQEFQRVSVLSTAG